MDRHSTHTTRTRGSRLCPWHHASRRARERVTRVAVQRGKRAAHTTRRGSSRSLSLRAFPPTIR